jgi:hypothetical protein
MVWRAADHRGLAELAALPRRLLRQFSKRRLDIEDAMALRGGGPGGGPRAAQAAALATRDTKVDIEFAERTRAWRGEADGYGWDARGAGRMDPEAGCRRTWRLRLGCSNVT